MQVSCRITEQSLLTKQGDESFVSIQVLGHHLLEHDALEDSAADGSKSSLRVMHRIKFKNEKAK